MNIQSDLFKFVALRPPMTPSQDAASRNFTSDDRNAKETPVGRFISQFTTENAASIPEKLKALIAAQQYNLAFPQSAGDTMLSATLAAVSAVPRDKVSAQALVTAIQAATGKQISCSMHQKTPRKYATDCGIAITRFIFSVVLRVRI